LFSRSKFESPFLLPKPLSGLSFFLERTTDHQTQQPASCFPDHCFPPPKWYLHRYEEFAGSAVQINMRHLSDALVYAFIYIDMRGDVEEKYLDEHMAALEKIGRMLSKCSERERRALRAAIERAIEHELDAPNPRMERLDRYRSWIAGLFGSR
jgi:hypothetical protein